MKFCFQTHSSQGLIVHWVSRQLEAQVTLVLVISESLFSADTLLAALSGLGHLSYGSYSALLYRPSSRPITFTLLGCVFPPTLIPTSSLA